MSNKSRSDSPEEAFRREQRGVAKGIAAAIGASLLVAALALALVPAPVAPEAGASESIAALLPWLAPLGLPLAGGVAAVAHHRFFHAGAIEGGDPPADRALAVARAFLQNTLEQTLLAGLAFLALAASLPPDASALLPVFVLWFVAARLAFRLGYPKGAAARAFGFAATFFPSVAALLVATALLLARALS
ncbi:hypothetical protein GCM10011390_09090 [Aureimonas endophytica]|uniref:MAPEG family protein n=1 Tax=Aureimonas endophytica TaxID=2027858 RepID=A0A917E1L3_9HYPH|nr:MAPEG family protein [Aureimonas endophytica]GGD92551.1 hypothetical protein GCM10011390_09090 [Aureimonas endophytica]